MDSQLLVVFAYICIPLFGMFFVEQEDAGWELQMLHTAVAQRAERCASEKPCCSVCIQGQLSLPCAFWKRQRVQRGCEERWLLAAKGSGCQRKDRGKRKAGREKYWEDGTLKMGNA